MAIPCCLLLELSWHSDPLARIEFCARCFASPIQFLRVKTRRAFSSDVITILNSIHQTLIHLIRSLEYIRARVCVCSIRLVRGYMHTIERIVHRGESAFRRRRTEAEWKWEEISAGAIDSQVGSWWDNVEDEGPPK